MIIDSIENYRPFVSGEEYVTASIQHGGWLKIKNPPPGDTYCSHYLPTFVSKLAITCVVPKMILNYKFDDLLERFVWADDGSPCGVLTDNNE